MMPKCKCGVRMKRGIIPTDIWGHSVFDCEDCGRTMKKLPVFATSGNNFKFWFGQIIYLIGVHHKWFFGGIEK